MTSVAFPGEVGMLYVDMLIHRPWYMTRVPATKLLSFAKHWRGSMELHETSVSGPPAPAAKSASLGACRHKYFLDLANPRATMKRVQPATAATATDAVRHTSCAEHGVSHASNLSAISLQQLATVHSCTCKAAVGGRKHHSPGMCAAIKSRRLDGAPMVLTIPQRALRTTFHLLNTRSWLVTFPTATHLPGLYWVAA